MSTRLSLKVAVLLVLPPLMWAVNAVVGRMAVGSISPLLLNALRWLLAFIILLPLGWSIFKRDSALWPAWRYFALVGLLGVGCYNALQYMALTTSNPVNVTLIAASMPVWMLLVGAIWYGQRPNRWEIGGVLLSIAGVLLVLSRGDWRHLFELRLVLGDVYMLVAIILWAFYSWQLVRPAPRYAGAKQWGWQFFLISQIAFGMLWASVAAGVEWASGYGHIVWSPWIIALIVFVAIGPSLIAFRCWGAGVAAAGPAMASFFSNLTPVFAALLSAIVLGLPPAWYHAVSFALIVAGIVVSSRRPC